MKRFAIILLAAAVASAQTIDDCLKQDSISCVQKNLYRKAKEFFGQDSLQIVDGVSLVKAEGRSARSGKEIVYDQEIDAAADVADRQNALENFVGDEVGDFLTGRSLKISLAPAFEKISKTARAVSDSVPQEIRQAVDEVVEGRGKKKILKSLLPLLIAAKAKIGLLMTLGYFAIAFLAKKAIFASIISIAISAFIGLKALWASKGGHDVTAYNGGHGGHGGWNNVGAVGGGGWSGGATSGGWAAPVSGSWDESHAYAQSQAYNGYHH